LLVCFGGSGRVGSFHRVPIIQILLGHFLVASIGFGWRRGRRWRGHHGLRHDGGGSGEGDSSSGRFVEGV
jgi:hypothetical protein